MNCYQPPKEFPTPPPRESRDRIKKNTVNSHASLTPGEHIRSHRKWKGYWHHGIYVGDAKVINYLEKGVGVQKTSYDVFTKGDVTERVPHPDAKFTPDEVVKRAKSRLGEDKYSLIFNNCEHFCNWCVEDEERSDQVRDRVVDLIEGVSQAIEEVKKSIIVYSSPVSRDKPTTPGKFDIFGKKFF
ncbi:MAG: lecithin retinol acyltransferase family protein [Deltaproteobacteria bacterium]|jgi:hypothetical protein|nr:lecithin retinol acyltransferase family protein [Deltaproteobacteria bacterium]